MKFQTKNPATGEVLGIYETMSKNKVFEIVAAVENSFNSWRNFPLSNKLIKIKRLAEVLRNNKTEYAKLITTEMGKPISESFAELEKCAWTAEVYADSTEDWLDEESVSVDGEKHRIVFEPLGIILSIMPWNFPFWQALRFAIPSLLVGNVSILKHSNTVPQCALAIERSFLEADFPKNVFKTLITDHSTIGNLIESEKIMGVSFTGSTEVGANIAALAGKNLKKMVLELGGSDPFIILEDADLDVVVKNATIGRTLNAGQSCIAAKRFIVMDKIADEFSTKFAKHMSTLRVGNPMNEDTEIGPLVNSAAIVQLESQVEDAISLGGTILTGGKRINGGGYFYEPTVVTNTKPEMKVVTEEVFGPIAPIIVVKDEQEAITVANSTKFGLGGSIWTFDLARGEKIARQIDAGAVFINSITKSDPRMPFGGVKNSGIGRELSKYGLKEFVNIKGLNIYKHN